MSTCGSYELRYASNHVSDCGNNTVLNGSLCQNIYRVLSSLTIVQAAKSIRS